MTPPLLVDLPNEVMRAILAFMTRKQLVALSAVNRQFYSIISSPPLTKKPLLEAKLVFFLHTSFYEKDVWTASIDAFGIRGIKDYFNVTERVPHEVEQILSWQWVRFESESHISVSSEQGIGYRRLTEFQRYSLTCPITTSHAGPGLSCSLRIRIACVELKRWRSTTTTMLNWNRTSWSSSRNLGLW